MQSPRLRLLNAKEIPTKESVPLEEIGVHAKAQIAAVTASRDLTAADNGKLLSVDSADGVTLTLPADLDAGFCLSVDQAGAGQVTFAAASGASLVNAHGYTKTYGQHAVAGLFVRSNADGASAVWVLHGETAS